MGPESVRYTASAFLPQKLGLSQLLSPTTYKPFPRNMSRRGRKGLGRYFFRESEREERDRDVRL
jgi:hypothetical protein